MLRLLKASFGGALRASVTPTIAPAQLLPTRSMIGPYAKYFMSGVDKVPQNLGTQLLLTNLPMEADVDSIKQFFDESNIISMYWRHPPDAQDLCECCVNFKSVDDARWAYSKNSEEFMGRAIQIEQRSERSSDCRTVFLANLSFDVKDEEIKEFVQDCGEVKTIFRVRYRGTNDFKGQVFCEFTTGEAVDKCMNLHGEMLLDRPVRMDYAKRNVTDSTPRGREQDWPLPTGKPDNCTALFMGNVSEDADSQEIEALAEECGAAISRINWLFDRDTNHFKGCGFIHFRNTESVDLFLVNHGRYVQGRRLRLNFPKNNVPRV